MKLQERVALVTGGSSGIGLAIVECYAAEGAAVVVVADVPGAVKETVAALRARGAQAEGIVCDVRIEAEVQQAVQLALARFGRLDVAVAAAGVRGSGTATETDEALWQRVIDVDLKGVFLTAKHAIGAMGTGGSIITIASQLGLVGTRANVAYCAAKGGVVNMTRAMALDCAPLGIRVNCICPGAVETPLLQASFADKPDPAQARAEWQALHPLGRLGQPADLAGAALFFASDDSSWVTGAILAVDGGFTAQ